MQQFKDSRNAQKVQGKPETAMLVPERRVKQQNLGNEYGKKSNCTANSSEKLGELLVRWVRHGWKGETSKEKLNLFLIASLTNAVKSNDMKTKIVNTQQDSKSR